jgi:hypothetical protein
VWNKRGVASATGLNPALRRAWARISLRSAPRNSRPHGPSRPEEMSWTTRVAARRKGIPRVAPKIVGLRLRLRDVVQETIVGLRRNPKNSPPLCIVQGKIRFRSARDKRAPARKSGDASCPIRHGRRGQITTRPRPNGVAHNEIVADIGYQIITQSFCRTIRRSSSCLRSFGDDLVQQEKRGGQHHLLPDIGDAMWRGGVPTPFRTMLHDFRAFHTPSH